MRLDKLKQAWRQYKLASALDQLEQSDILAIIEGPEARVSRISKIAVINGLLLPLMMIGCQGG